jgi:hypothetical protein
MKILRWLGAGLIAIVAGVLALVGLILCVTLVLAPLGIPILMLARRVFALAGRMVVPRALRHPIDELDRSGEEKTAKLKRKAKDGARSGADQAQSAGKSATKRGKKVAKRGKKAAKRGRKKKPTDAVPASTKRFARRLRPGS